MECSAADLTIDRLAEKPLVERLKRLPELVDAEHHLIDRGRFVTLDFQVVIGAWPCFVPVRQGRVEAIELAPQRMRSSAFVLRALPSACEKFWQPMPEPCWHDLFAMNKKGNIVIEGDLHPFMANLQYFKDVMALPRKLKAVAP